MGMFSESIDVVCTTTGQPLRLRWAGREYSLCAEPVRWYERRQWWAEESRAPLGRGPGLVDHEIWRVQVREDSPAQRNAASADASAGADDDDVVDDDQSLTLDLSRHASSGRWRLIRIHDALRPHSA